MATLHYIFPFFIVSDVRVSIPFYVDMLGFEVRYLAPEDSPFFAIVGRDHISLMLKAIVPGVGPVPNHTRHEWARWDAYLSVDDPDGLYEEYQAKGVEFRTPIRVNEDGLRGFEVADADGYVLFFGRPKTD